MNQPAQECYSTRQQVLFECVQFLDCQYNEGKNNDAHSSPGFLYAMILGHPLQTPNQVFCPTVSTELIDIMY